MNTSIDHAARAQALFMEGYSCAQAVVCAFTDVTGLDLETSARLASSFGGGLSRLRELCGTVSGAALVLGIARGYSDPKDYGAKKAHYALVQEFARRFREANGAIVCRELLKGTGATAGGAPEVRTDAYYDRRPCAALVACSAGILEQMLSE